MSDILEQISNLTEQFSNLFEVEGLGDPASDVPPSTNKIKKDRKTKDGKVELVSVEDELFPYDGNKREQYRQKIIDTINGMIQGTSTLEDLLQIVRQKKIPVKEGFEGAIELLTNLLEKETKSGENTVKKISYEKMPSGYVCKITYHGSGYNAWGEGNADHNFLSKDEYEKETGKKYDELKEGFESNDILEDIILELKDETKASAIKGRVDNFKNTLKNLWRNQALGAKKGADIAKQNFNLAKEKLDKSNSLYNRSIKDVNKKQEIVDYVHNTKKDLDNYANELKNKQAEIRKFQDEAIRAFNATKYSDKEKYPYYSKFGAPLKYPKYEGK